MGKNGRKVRIMRTKLTLRQKWWLGILATVALGFFVWEFWLPYRYFATPLWGIAGLRCAHAFLLWLRPRKPRLTRVLRTCLILTLVIGTGCFCTVEGFIVSAARGSGEDCDYLLVLGAAVKGKVPGRALAERLQGALDYLNAHPETVCIVSGGQGLGEEITEAQCMRDWLVEHGLPAERVLMEDRATSTWENINFTLALLESRDGQRPQRLGILSSEYHLYRAGLMARDLGIEAVGIPAATHPWPNRIHYYLREFFGVVHYKLLGR